MKQRRAIGVLGGMGPYATAHLYRCLLEESRLLSGSVQDNEFPNIIINSLSLSGSDELGVPPTKDVLGQLHRGVTVLQKSGADIVVIACISAHSMIRALRSGTTIPILDAVFETMQAMRDARIRDVLLLTSYVGYKEPIWQTGASIGITYHLPKKSDRQDITRVIMKCMEGNNTVAAARLLERIIRQYTSDNSVSAVILGCSELSMLAGKIHGQPTIYDPMRLVARKAVQYAAGQWLPG